jgi:hypothetical protein
MMFRIRQPDPGQMEHPDLNGPLILLIYHQPSDFSRKSLKQTYLLMDRVDNKLYGKSMSSIWSIWSIGSILKLLFLIALAEIAFAV